ncbi:MAG: efflux RND transporter periplasmic adaptor subunit [Acidobacteriota bacterium]
MPNPLRRLWRPLLTLLVIAGLVFAGLQLRTFLERPPEVEVAEVRREDVARVLALTGRVRPQLRNRIAPVVRARLLEVQAEEGEAVRAGQVLARLDARPLKSSIAQIEAEIEREAEELRQRQRDAERAEALGKSDLIAASELEDARLRVELGERRIARLREEISELEARLDDYVLRSPIDGWVLERPVDPGQTVGPEEVLYELATAGDALVEVEVDEQYLGELALGQAATVALISGRRTRWQAEISYISKRIDRLSGAAVIRLRFIDEAPDLPTGLSLDINLLIEEHPQALTVPRSAVGGLGGSQSWVLAIEGDRTARRPVEVVDWPAPRLVLLSGLEAGDRVVLAPKQVAEDLQVRPLDTDTGDGS